MQQHRDGVNSDVDSAPRAAASTQPVSLDVTRRQAITGGSLALGVMGYHWIARLGWVDAILNASMILAGMGPVDPLQGNAAKLFASAYAMFSGVMFLTSVGMLMTPVVHHFMHRFHLEEAKRG